ncbi:MAG: hypothetical protein M1816_000451 [Peltula sp. TS41687]|nr:MAG: hypothetical protein M1816_000451 [Peltula sp. TS41687]
MSHPVQKRSISGAFGFLKSILIPALISLTLYVVFSYLLLPFVRRHRHRYNQYVPLNSLAARTTSIRHRIYDGLIALLFPSSWFRGRDGRLGDDDGSERAGDEDEDDLLTDAEEGESMVGLELDAERREALERRRGEFGEGERRLSRELEEGFRDDSDDEQEEEEEETEDARCPRSWRNAGQGPSGVSRAG